MKRIIPLFAVLIAAAGLMSCADINNDPAILPQDLIKRGVETVTRFNELPELRGFSKHLPGAAAVVILPTVVKAGFIGAAEVGHGMLLAHKSDGSWSHPVFYTLAAGSFGLQIGIQDTEVIMIVRSEKALQSIIEHQGKLGADAGITVGLFGAGVEAATTTNVNADILAFANAKIGLFGGFSLEGSVLTRRNDLNEAYYGVGALPRSIIEGLNYANPKADPLREALGGK
ncbi:MAG: hypothetical protein A3G18_13430 [Rhodospirillales bacterium RIFCSPLOWO2_12_FULL_58_28]|nr:MAG: hypothetical protein A3H92_13285 [Rhodospirillales bacterium RIFCSPLOWO2_02_FULL_58_16]OHC78574.1 MAG: hypothetical protein A3G18_13430 [Rhodospirillales bacterium RIFCSPLOWO2_12_FULL_58_28]